MDDTYHRGVLDDRGSDGGSVATTDSVAGHWSYLTHPRYRPSSRPLVVDTQDTSGCCPLVRSPDTVLAVRPSTTVLLLQEQRSCATSSSTA
eukprot:ctg_2707.g390